MHRDFSADGYSPLIRPQVESAGRQTERGGEEAELAASMVVELALGVVVVSDAVAEIESGSGR
jgi:hypothetical protein